jgi:uncharacterized protein
VTASMRALWALLLLAAANAFMTTAWYYHLRKAEWTLFAAVGVSWLIALPEYCLQVPANRLGNVAFGGPFTTPQMKIMQEAITIVVFAIFSSVVLKERLKGTDWIAFGLVLAAVAVSQLGRVR